MAVDAKQREWMWEFFLKNCKDALLIEQLMNALPFPTENLDLRKLLWLRSLSLQISAGIIDDLTLKMLRALGEHIRVSEARKEKCSADLCSQEVAKKRKLQEDRSNDVEVAFPVEGTNSLVKGGRVLPWNLEQRRESSTDTRKAEIVVGIRDWMKGKALPRSVGGNGSVEEQTIASKQDKEGTNSGQAGPCDETKDRTWSDFVFRHGEIASQWELELAVMLELAVKHLRAETPDWKLFENALAKYWGDFTDDTDGWPAADVLEMARVRDQIKSELWMVRRRPELLDGVVQKYTKDKVVEMLKTHLERAWAETGQTFLERVSADVINGVYKPVNFNGSLPNKAGTPLEDAEVGRESTDKHETGEKPWIRASRGRYSKSREKLQKNFAIWDLDDDAEGGVIAKLPVSARAGDGRETRAEHQGGGVSKQQDGASDIADIVNDRNADKVGEEERLSVSTGEGIGINARSVMVGTSLKDVGVARILDFEVPSGKVRLDEQQQNQDTTRANIEATEAEHRIHEAKVTAAVPGKEVVVDFAESRPTLDTTIDQSAPNVINFPERTESSTVDDEKGANGESNAKSTTSQDAELEDNETVVNKENVVPPPSPNPVGPKQNLVCFSPPPWVAGSPALNVTDGMAPGLTRKRNPGSNGEETGAATEAEELRSAEIASPTHCSDQTPDTPTAQRNLKRKQAVLDSVVQDPLPKILRTCRARGSLLERNATARTVEWEEDDIEESPSSSPSASRHVRLPHPTTHRISPLVQKNGRGAGCRRKPRRWSEFEVNTLKLEVGKYGKGRWKLILESNQEAFHGRTEVDLKDKWRNLERFEGVTS